MLRSNKLPIESATGDLSASILLAVSVVFYREKAFHYPKLESPTSLFRVGSQRSLQARMLALQSLRSSLCASFFAFA